MNKVFKTPILENIRVHYADIRSIFPAETNGREIFIFISRLGDLTLDPSIVEAYVNNMRGFWDYFKNIIIQCINNESHCKAIGNKPRLLSVSLQIGTEEWQTYVLHLLHKMIYSYNHPDIQKKLVALLKNETDKIKHMLELIDKFVDKYLTTHKDMLLRYDKKRDPIYSIKHNYRYTPYDDNELVSINIRTELFDLAYQIENIIHVNIMYMDIFFLRRFLDKDYIKNVVAYTGGLHSNNYIKILIQDFDFRITHVAYAEELDMDKLTNQIKSSKHLAEIEYLLYPPELYQCSDLSHFPKNFD